MDLTGLITAHFLYTKKVWPDTWQALGWAITELGEVFELLLNEDPPGWVRNHPEDKESYSPERLEEELGDVMMMLQVAGMRRGLDPLGRMIQRLAQGLPDEIGWEEKWDHWHNGIPAPDQDLTDLPLFEEGE